METKVAMMSKAAVVKDNGKGNNRKKKLPENRRE